MTAKEYVKGMYPNAMAAKWLGRGFWTIWSHDGYNLRLGNGDTAKKAWDNARKILQSPDK